MIVQHEIVLQNVKRGFHIITQKILDTVGNLPEYGLMNIFVQHTSAGITINENADPTVRQDFESYFNHLVPENLTYFKHTLEGADDMPAHIKASIVGNSITIPISGNRLNLGTWQGIIFCEFRDYPSRRRLVITIYS